MKHRGSVRHCVPFALRNRQHARATARPALHSVNYRRIVFGLVTAFGAARRAVCGPADSGDGRESGRAERDGEYDAEVRPRDGEACRGGSNTPWRTLTGMFDSAHAAIAPLASPARVMMPASAQTNAPSWRRLAPSAAAVAKVRRCSWRCFGRGSSRTISSRLSVCCSEPATTPVRGIELGAGLASCGLGIVRAWHRALESVGHRPLRVYDCRHAAATTCLRAGMPPGETARRLGHSVETLVSTYVGALDDEEHVANKRIDSILG